MSYDDQFCRAMKIKLDEPLESSSARMREDPQACITAEVAIEIHRAEEPGFVMLSEQHCWALLDANRAVGQLATDRLNTARNWIERAGENDQAMRQWRRAFLALAIGVGVVTLLQALGIIGA